MKVVLDTNVLVSATFWYGDSNEIIKRVEDKTVELVLSKDIVQEFSDVLNRDEILEKVKDKHLEVRHSLQKILELSTIIDPNESVDIIKDDLTDNMVLACARAGKVGYIISQDRHLLKLGEFEGVRIVTPSDFLKTIARKNTASQASRTPSPGR